MSCLLASFVDNYSSSKGLRKQPDRWAVLPILDNLANPCQSGNAFRHRVGHRRVPLAPSWALGGRGPE